jgi:CRISPR-associated protein Csx10
VAADKTTARDSEGAPIIPGSAIKGAIRIEAERLARARNQIDDSCRPPRVTCGKDTCLTCSLFGSARQPNAADGEGKLRFGDARLVDNRGLFVEPDGKSTGLGYGLRNGVAVNRKRRVQQDRTLHTLEAPLAGGGWMFAGDLTVVKQLTPQEQELLSAAARAVVAIGGERSRGLGACTIELADESFIRSPMPLALNGDRARITVTLQAPTLIGDVRPEQVQLDETRLLVPGSAIRGALAFILPPDLRSDPAFQPTFLPLRFTDLRIRPPAASAPAFPAPLTALTCKANPGFRADPDAAEAGHGVWDMLVLNVLLRPAYVAGAAPVLPRRCRTCGGPAKELSGYVWKDESNRFGGVEVWRRIVTRAAIDRRQGSTAAGLLYSLEALEPGQTFEGEVCGLTEQARGLAAQWHDCITFLGADRARGFGAAQVLLSEGNPRESVGARLDAFSNTLNAAKELVACAFPGTQLRDGLFFSVTLLSDTILDETNDAASSLLDALGIGSLDVSTEQFAVRSTQASGWDRQDNRNRPKPLVPALSSGSVFLFSAPTSLRGALSEALQRAEAEAIGRRREEGYGEVAVCHEFHTKQFQSGELEVY